MAIAALIMATFIAAPAPPVIAKPDPQSQAADAKGLIGTLDRILGEYERAGTAKDVGKLVDLDRELRDLLGFYPWETAPRFQYHIWKKRWTNIGVVVGHYSGLLLYTDKLLVEARKLDEDGTYRKHTLYSDIHGTGTSHGLGVMPKIGVAHRYIKEFPDGPFAFETAWALGGFYFDLHKAILLAEKGVEDYKVDCFRKYIRDEDLQGQMRTARHLAIHYFRIALELLPAGPRRRSLSRHVQRVKEVLAVGDTGVWHYCAD